MSYPLLPKIATATLTFTPVAGVLPLCLHPRATCAPRSAILACDGFPTNMQRLSNKGRKIRNHSWFKYAQNMVGEMSSDAKLTLLICRRQLQSIAGCFRAIAGSTSTAVEMSTVVIVQYNGSVTYVKQSQHHSYKRVAIQRNRV